MKTTLKNLSLLFVFFLISNLSIAQINSLDIEKPSFKNSISIEGFGHGFLYSINYERTLFEFPKTFTSANIGISYYGKNNGIVPLWIPVSINQSFEIIDNQFLEIGFGKMFRNDRIEYNDNTFENQYQFEDWIYRLGYRYHFNEEKCLFKLAYTPMILDRVEIVHWGAISFGYRF